MKELWRYKLDCSIENVSFGEDYLVVGSGSELYCLDTQGILWKRRMKTTFYRDPYSDVSITALNAKGSVIAAGTNFMDGKIYLLTKAGKLLWEHQFATIASLGWRPEDVTAIGLGDNCVATGTEFIGEYVYVYTFRRKRVFLKRVAGTVRAIAINGSVAVGTDTRLYVFDFDGEERFSIPAQTADVKVTKDGIVFASGNKISLIADDGGELWHESFDGRIEQLFYHNNKIYAVAGTSITLLSENGDVLNSVELEGNPAGIGKAGILTHDRNTLRLYPLPD
ncbi:MAG: PQQ-binding-like beta-propeller repeat protein [Euryarchaeota archaeon]|nr:PQQ-binding-like beta-propeller repeat protein [Euryarchaeota archaeon]